jgi:hypothetical protein
VGTVLSVEPWKGIPAPGRRVKRHLTGIEGIYRYGAVADEKQTLAKKIHPVPESAEQYATRRGFGGRKSYSVLLRLKRSGEKDVVDSRTVHPRAGILYGPTLGPLCT